MPNLLVFGCSCHLIDLVLEKLVENNKSWKQIEDDVWAIQKAFRIPRMRTALKPMGGSVPLLPADTRFHYLVDMLENFISNLTPYRRAWAEDENRRILHTKDVRVKLIFDEDLIEKTKALYDSAYENCHKES